MIFGHFIVAQTNKESISLFAIFTMAGSIKIFQVILQLYQTMGIYPPQTKQRFKFNLRIFLFMFALMELFITTLACLWFDAKTVFEFGTSFYGCISGKKEISISCNMLIWMQTSIIECVLMLHNRAVRRIKDNLITKRCPIMNAICGSAFMSFFNVNMTKLVLMWSQISISKIFQFYYQWYFIQ